MGNVICLGCGRTIGHTAGKSDSYDYCGPCADRIAREAEQWLQKQDREEKKGKKNG